MFTSCVFYNSAFARLFVLVPHTSSTGTITCPDLPRPPSRSVLVIASHAIQYPPPYPSSHRPHARAAEIQRRLLSSHHREEPPAHEEAASSAAGQPQQGQREKPRVSLKWPNDVLLGESKVAGVLIEAELPFLLVGIGVNVRHKPEVPRHGPDRGRPAACLADFGVDSTDEVGRVVACFFLRASPLRCERSSTIL